MIRDAALAAVFVAGLALVAAGVGLIFAPAGMITAGAAAASCAVLYARGNR